MECCNYLNVSAVSGGIMLNHPYVIGRYKKIGVCGGRSIYQNMNNSDIFIYYGCGRWFIGLEIGVCGGWIFSPSLSICVHQPSVWQFIGDNGLLTDLIFRINDECGFHQQNSSLNEDDIDESLKRPLQNYGDSSKYDLSNTYQTYDQLTPEYNNPAALLPNTQNEDDNKEDGKEYLVYYRKEN
ncbi:uncharacterized protein LOC111714874 [Eurytemora carolleeae]|uniref:uncharacterized protein LOC111714874 n=1 Tax=Eurytemora carolleeae TaxID=1294199 RepID=UPI000C790F47|nr:uncharacterized protein LOC111714874 [Eurytemora carolleeae]|eukprot:XP_023345855.1 uncharacterized protein LOC111714874 [Eurytemora affinis]